MIRGCTNAPRCSASTAKICDVRHASLRTNAQCFVEDDEGRLFAGLQEALSASAFRTLVSSTELREFAHNQPALAQAQELARAVFILPSADPVSGRRA